jgi:hypothetical protein
MAKGEANKWLLGIPIVNGSIRVGIETESDPQGLEPPSIKSGYILLDWDEEIAQNATGVHHLCSDRCALTNQARYLREDVKVRTA